MPEPVLVRLPAPEPPLPMTPLIVALPDATATVSVRAVLLSERATLPESVAFESVSTVFTPVWVSTPEVLMFVSELLPVSVSVFAMVLLAVEVSVPPASVMLPVPNPVVEFVESVPALTVVPPL